MDIKQIINEFRSLESTTHKDNTYNVISLFDMLHKLGASKERYPMFFIATNDALIRYGNFCQSNTTWSVLSMKLAETLY